MAIRREHAGAAAPTTITTSIDNAVGSWTLTNGSGYPTGAVGPFVCVIDQGLTTEEKVLVTSRSGNNLTGITRGYDNTTAQSHAILASFSHCFSAIEADEANALAVRAPAGSATLVDLSSTQTLTNKTLTSPAINAGAQTGVVLDATSTLGGVSGTQLAALQQVYSPAWTSFSANGYYNIGTAGTFTAAYKFLTQKTVVLRLTWSGATISGSATLTGFGIVGQIPTPKASQAQGSSNGGDASNLYIPSSADRIYLYGGTTGLVVAGALPTLTSTLIYETT